MRQPSLCLHIASVVPIHKGVIPGLYAYLSYLIEQLLGKLRRKNIQPWKGTVQNPVGSDRTRLFIAYVFNAKLAKPKKRQSFSAFHKMCAGGYNELIN